MAIRAAAQVTGTVERLGGLESSSIRLWLRFSAMSDSQLTLLLDELRRRGKRLTTARRVLLHELAEADAHLSVEELADRVQAGHEGMHRATVYRTLDTLTDLGMVEHTHFGHGPAVYHLSSNLHQHLICESCGKVVEVPASVFQRVERDLDENYGFVMRSQHFAIEGRCRACAQKSERRVPSQHAH